MRAMSFDIFLQRFDDDAATGRSAAALKVLEPWLTNRDDSCARVVTTDGESDVYGLGTDGLMFTHSSGEVILQLMVDVARAAEYAIIPVGCPTCVISPAMIGTLPPELSESVALVASGTDLQRVIDTA
jgi:hypothetical protein